MSIDDRGRAFAIRRAVQDVEDVGLGGDAVLESQFNDAEHSILVVLQNEDEDIHHLSVAPWPLEKLGLELAKCFRHLSEGDAVAQGSRLALDHCQVVPPGTLCEEEAAPRLKAAYASVARLLNAELGEVAPMESATRAWDAALTALSFVLGDRIVTGRAEYASNMLTLLHAARRQGVAIDVALDDADGQLNVAALEGMIGARTRLIALTHAAINSGLVNPVPAVGRLAQAAGVPFLLDACQSVGQIPLDVAAIGCDMLTATGRKFLRAPRGTGFLYVRRAWLDRLDPPTLDLRAAVWTGPDQCASWQDVPALR